MYYLSTFFPPSNTTLGVAEMCNGTINTVTHLPPGVPTPLVAPHRCRTPTGPLPKSPIQQPFHPGPVDNTRRDSPRTFAGTPATLRVAAMRPQRFDLGQSS